MFVFTWAVAHATTPGCAPDLPGLLDLVPGEGASAVPRDARIVARIAPPWCADTSLPVVLTLVGDGGEWTFESALDPVLDPEWNEIHVWTPDAPLAAGTWTATVTWGDASLGVATFTVEDTDTPVPAAPVEIELTAPAHPSYASVDGGGEVHWAYEVGVRVRGETDPLGWYLVDPEPGVADGTDADVAKPLLVRAEDTTVRFTFTTTGQDYAEVCATAVALGASGASSVAVEGCDTLGAPTQAQLDSLKFGGGQRAGGSCATSGRGPWMAAPWWVVVAVCGLGRRRVRPAR